ncbi:MAG: hypothetical protein U5L07_14745 [Desulfobacterales bacterium]|nr:hypothetical protein [Desulfobacterales bacterium]
MYNKKRLGEENIRILLAKENYKEDFLKPYNRMLHKSYQVGRLVVEDADCIEAEIALKSRIMALKNNNFIYSDERLLGSILGYTSTLYPKARYASEFLRKLLFDLNYETTIILYIRNQDELVESSYLQYFREQGPKHDFESFYQGLKLERLSWRNVVDPFVSDFSEDCVIIKNYGLIRENLDYFIQDFFQIFSDLKDIKLYEKTINPSFSVKAMEIYGIVFPYLTSQERNKFQKVLKESFPLDEYPAPFLLTSEQRESLISRYNKENKMLVTDMAKTETCMENKDID